ncbi:MAG: GtrA family protein [Anaerolineaceae bacterium]|nr:GtrA family protein [Anaerolineaceae bacterium]
MLISNKKERIRFFRFAIVGAIGAVVDFGILNLLLALNVSYLISATISFIAAVLNNFTWNRFWTYPDSRSKPISQQLVQFAVINVIGIGIRIPLLAVLEKILVNVANNSFPEGIWVFSPVKIGQNLGLVVAILVVMLWNFFANRLWTYNDVDKKD